MTNKFIAIEGVIGVGKTTLARLLQPHFANSSVLLELFEENPFLADFYQNRAQYAFQTQIFFLLSRYHQQHEAVPAALQRGHLLSDYTFAKDELFAWLNLKDDELAMYGRVHAALGDKIPKPDLIVYLQADHEVVMRRIASRDRSYERDMDPEYIRQLAAAYEAWVGNMQETAVLTLDASNLDFLSNPADLPFAAARIKETLAAHTPARPLADGQLKLLEDGRLSTFQTFHRELDAAISVEPDLRDELADLLAYTLKLANYVGIDLEQAYLEKMQKNIRAWPLERTQPSNQ
jgi:deoxyguanosine kinase